MNFQTQVFSDTVFFLICYCYYFYFRCIIYREQILILICIVLFSLQVTLKLIKDGSGQGGALVAAIEKKRPHGSQQMFSQSDQKYIYVSQMNILDTCGRSDIKTLLRNVYFCISLWMIFSVYRLSETQWKMLLYSCVHK